AQAEREDKCKQHATAYPTRVPAIAAGTSVRTNSRDAATVTTIWDAILERMQVSMPAEDFRRWFSGTAYASDSGDQITVWVPTESIRRHLVLHYQDAIDRALAALGR